MVTTKPTFWAKTPLKLYVKFRHSITFKITLLYIKLFVSIANYYRTGSINYRGTGVQLSPAYSDYYKLMEPAQVSPAAMATDPYLHCQTQFTVTLTTRPVVRVSAHTRASITNKTAPVQTGTKDKVQDDHISLFSPFFVSQFFRCKHSQWQLSQIPLIPVLSPWRHSHISLCGPES